MGELGNHLDGGGVGADEPKSDGGDFQPIPVGWRAVEIEKAEVASTKAKNGTLLKIQASVITEDRNGRKVFTRINVQNPSVACTEIGRRELAALADACSIPFLDDEDKLIGKQLEMKLVIVDNQGKPDNDVKGFRPLGGAAPAAATTPQKQQAQTKAPDSPAPPSPGDKKSMPWEK